MKPNPMEPAAGLFMCGLALVLALFVLWGGAFQPVHETDLPLQDALYWVEVRESGTGRVLVPMAEKPGTAKKTLSGASELVLGLKMDLNRASGRDMELLSGIGPYTARNIVKRREELGGFDSLDELESIPGMSGFAFKSLEKWARIQPDP